MLLAGLAVRMCAQDKFYLGINPLSYALALPLQEDVKRYSPVLSGNEYGFSLAGGYYLHQRIALEARLSLGPLHQVASVKQLHTGMIVHPFLKKENKDVFPFYTGMFIKIWDYRNRLTDIHFYNASPYAVLGYQFNQKHWMLDLRLNQSLAIVSWTNLENTRPGASAFFSPWPELIKVLPSITCTIGYRFSPKQPHS